ncbi:hypothetical protein [Mycobacterium riyadhense]|uniref:Uncharacterized protein n=1 Tax=Mycobacterium riyadhense TaxID=486698 RepID=A0A653EID9_9MYCO|nr:hypothetical protein BIN_B_01999 [Mycobacterium riyadhense]
MLVDKRLTSRSMPRWRSGCSAGTTGRIINGDGTDRIACQFTSVVSRCCIPHDLDRLFAPSVLKPGGVFA